MDAKEYPYGQRNLHKFLKAGFVEKGKLNATDQGTPQEVLFHRRCVIMYWTD